ncbi:MAG: hypothetical protein WDM85_10720 [Caulobacteraceae bacterium]
MALREGVLFEAMAPACRAQDPLIEGCAALSAREGVNPALGPAVEAWLAPAFGALEPVLGMREPVLLKAASRLADMGARLHPDHRADLVFHQVLRAPVPGMNHAERVFLATHPVRSPHRRRHGARAGVDRPATDPRAGAAGPGPGRRHPPCLRPFRPQPGAAATFQSGHPFRPRW